LSAFTLHDDTCRSALQRGYGPVFNNGCARGSEQGVDEFDRMDTGIVPVADGGAEAALERVVGNKVHIEAIFAQQFGRVRENLGFFGCSGERQAATWDVVTIHGGMSGQKRPNVVMAGNRRGKDSARRFAAVSGDGNSVVVSRSGKQKTGIAAGCAAGDLASVNDSQFPVRSGLRQGIGR